MRPSAKDKAHFQSVRYKDQVRTLKFDNNGRKPRMRAKDPQAQAPKPKVGHSAYPSTVHRTHSLKLIFYN